MQRRSFITALAVGLAALAGCANPDYEDEHGDGHDGDSAGTGTEDGGQEHDHDNPDHDHSDHDHDHDDEMGGGDTWEEEGDDYESGSGGY